MDISQTPPSEVPRCLRSSWTQALVESIGRTLQNRTIGALRAGPAPAPAPAPRTVPADRLDEVDGDAVAQWVVDQYPASSYPAVIIGSAHGSVAHLAAAMGAPWLPIGFECDVVWADGRAFDVEAAIQGGRAIASAIVEWNPGVAVRQVCDPIRRSAVPDRELTFHVRWRDLPPAYADFLDQRLVPGGAVVILADERTWPVLDRGLPVSFQLGTPRAGLTWDGYQEGLTKHWPEWASSWPQAMCTGEWGDGEAELGIEPSFLRYLRDWARGADHPAMVVGYNDPSQWSAALADVYRRWLRSMGRDADRLVVECGRLFDPNQVLTAGLVPYWCEGSTIASLSAVELWLAGHRPFTHIILRPDPTGHERTRIAELSHWHGLGAFGAQPRTWQDLLRLPTDADPAVAQPLPVLPRLSVRGLIIGLRTLAMNSPGSEAALYRLETWASQLQDRRAAADG